MSKQILYKLKLDNGYYNEVPQSWKSIRAIIGQYERGKFNWGLYNRTLVEVEQYEVTTKHTNSMSIEDFKEIKKCLM